MKSQNARILFACLTAGLLALPGAGAYTVESVTFVPNPVVIPPGGSAKVYAVIYLNFGPDETTDKWKDVWLLDNDNELFDQAGDGGYDEVLVKSGGRPWKYGKRWVLIVEFTLNAPKGDVTGRDGASGESEAELSVEIGTNPDNFGDGVAYAYGSSGIEAQPMSSSRSDYDRSSRTLAYGAFVVAESGSLASDSTGVAELWLVGPGGLKKPLARKEFANLHQPCVLSGSLDARKFAPGLYRLAFRARDFSGRVLAESYSDVRIPSSRPAIGVKGLAAGGAPAEK